MQSQLKGGKQGMTWSGVAAWGREVLGVPVTYSTSQMDQLLLEGPSCTPSGARHIPSTPSYRTTHHMLDTRHLRRAYILTMPTCVLQQTLRLGLYAKWQLRPAPRSRARPH